MLGFKGALSLTLSFWLFCTVVSWYSFNGGSCCNGMLQLLSGGQKFQYHEGLCRSGSTGKRPKEDGVNFLYLRVPLDVLCVFPRCFPCCSVGVSADIPHKGGLPLHIRPCERLLGKCEVKFSMLVLSHTHATNLNGAQPLILTNQGLSSIKQSP